MTVNRIGRKNFLTKLAAKRIQIWMRCKDGQNMNKLHSFSPILLKWNKEKNNRQMPWKGEKDPYKIWLSEIILQQTRVEQGLKYYEKLLPLFRMFINWQMLPNEVFISTGKDWDTTPGAKT